ncbi:MAG TPA: aminotransferase class I/II-fold pyridoxal phosphate-dependent enzyme [Saprospiraceae bacterium]|nr:aminotransferase class I/II-fold pyridoxal phosphate-dependent enzyme [Saprospiraceae bacterium]
MEDHISFILNDLGEHREKYFNAMSPPIIQTSNFVFPAVADFRNAILDELNSHIYTKGNNPTVEILRKKIAALEATDDALIFASGTAAISMTIMSCVGQGDHVICVRHPYSWTATVLSRYLVRFGVTYDFVDGSNLDAIEALIKPNTKLLFLESPNTFTYELQDITACVALAKKHNMLTAIDNSHASPIFQQPAKMGVDIIIHSATKYINGHSDVVAGVVCSSHAIIKKMFIDEYMVLGGIISPHDASLIIRGLRTLPIRMERVQSSTQVIVAALKGHKAIKRILYPFDVDFPQYELAKKQMTGCGGLFTIEFDFPDIETLLKVVGKVKRWKIAVSWGGHEALMLPMAALYNLPGRDNPHIPWNFVRFYVGLEEPDYLLEDLLEALEI